MPFRIFESCSRITKLHKLYSIVIFISLLLTFDQLGLLPLSTLGREAVGFQSSSSAQDVRWGPFELMDFPGFLNSGDPAKRSCHDLQYSGTIGVQKSHHIYDNLTEIALSLNSHPVVSPSDINDSHEKINDVVGRKWTRMSASSIWLPEQRVFMVVTRIVYIGPKEDLNNPKASFLRGQVFNEDWEQLDNHTVTWNGEAFTFPMMFDIPTEYEGGGGQLYGQEDPRIILEDDVKGAEPVIIFNMGHSRSEWKRAMYIFRPFSNFSTILTIRGEARQEKEKNWAPFFFRSGDSRQESDDRRRPDEFLHFVYGFKPLRILKCHLTSGDCDFVFQQKVPAHYVTHHNEKSGSLRGGTNFVPVPIPSSYHIHPDVHAYAAFARTNTDEHCGVFYRPEFIVMVYIKGYFHLVFAGEALDFGSSILEHDTKADPCGKDRILIPNSIGRWDARQDIMTVTWSVDDRSNLVGRLQGVLSFVRDLPQFHGLLRKDGPLNNAERDLMDFSSWIGDDVRACCVESSVNYTLAAKEMHKLQNS